ncbi:MAG: hypothetical protein JWQ52_1963 [Phenylobacterium sp.]|nr:hypothetical protein [Phenylobacterium sp.]
MARHRYRSQPALQRSSGRTASAILGLGLLAGVALGAGVLVSTLVRGLGPGSDKIQAVAPRDEPARLAAPLDTPAADLPPVTPPVTPPAATVQAAPEPQASAPPVVRLKAPRPARVARTANPPNYPVFKPMTTQDQWEQQRLDYERARDAYDANERKEGFRWAQQNKIRVQRYCASAQQRSAAFVEGCMSYLRPMKTEAPDRPREPASPDLSDPG